MINNLFIVYDITDYIELNDKSIKIYIHKDANHLFFLNSLK